MSDSSDDSPPKPRRAKDGTGETLRFLVILAVAAVLLRSLVAAPFNIPSVSMMPRLLVGDYLFVAKWPYGWSRANFPYGLAPISGRIWGAAPERGDVVVFKNPADESTDYIKRVIGLPGDQIQMRRGQLFINGVGVPKVRVADLQVPVTPNSPCAEHAGTMVKLETGPAGPVCRYPRYRETLPNGRSYEVLDIAYIPPADDTAVYIVPEDHYFLMGDNRDRSADSRFPAQVNGAIGLVPAKDLVGRAMIMFWSTDGSASWFLPWTWFTACRWDRIGGRFS
jgi:signal peptidase I